MWLSKFVRLYNGLCSGVDSQEE